MDHLAQRFDDGHYYLNSALCLALPVAVAVRVGLPTLGAGALDQLLASSSTWTSLGCAVAIGSLVSISVSNSRRSSDTLESLHASLTLQLRLANLFGFILSRQQLGTGTKGVAFYSLAWLATSFFYPQPPYLGPKAFPQLSDDEFDTQILLLPSAQRAALDFASTDAHPSHNDNNNDNDDDNNPRTPSLAIKERWNLVLFHAEWSTKSRQLELTLSRLSHRYSSSNSLAFFLVSPESAPQTFYDLSLPTTPMTSSATSDGTLLPLVRMYRQGKVVHEEPSLQDHNHDHDKRGERTRNRRSKFEDESKTSRQRRRRGGRGGDGTGRKDGGEQPFVRQMNDDDRDDDDDEGENEDEDERDSESESEDERDVERRRAVARYRWDRRGAALERAFKLEERSGIFVSRPSSTR